MTFTEKIKRVPNKIKRIILQFGLIRVISEFLYQRRIKKYVKYLPKIDLEDLKKVESLHEEGVFITSLEKLAIPSTSLVNASAKKLLPELLAVSNYESDDGNYVISLPLFKLMKYPEIFLWGLEERLLNIIENYIGLPVLYHGAHFRREVANGKLIGVRQWHIDIEDHRMVRIIIYLNNVTLNGGPFEYISKSLSTSLRKTLQYTSGFISDEIIKTVVSTSNWKPCFGCAGTVIFSDTGNIFHRAKPPAKVDRYSITYSYTSRRPITIFNKAVLTRDELLELSSKLSLRQRQCILGYSNF